MGTDFLSIFRRPDVVYGTDIIGTFFGTYVQAMYSHHVFFACLRYYKCPDDNRSISSAFQASRVRCLKGNEMES